MSDRDAVTATAVRAILTEWARRFGSLAVVLVALGSVIAVAPSRSPQGNAFDYRSAAAPERAPQPVAPPAPARSPEPTLILPANPPTARIPVTTAPTVTPQPLPPPSTTTTTTTAPAPKTCPTINPILPPVTLPGGGCP